MTRIKISLLPIELKKQSSMMKVWTILALVLAVVALILLAGNILFSFWLQTPVAELESLKAQNKSMTENIGRLSYIQEMFDEIETNNTIITGLKGNNPDYAYLIDETSKNLTVYGLNMSRMEIIAVGESKGCLIEGSASNTDDIQKWLVKAGSLDGVETVELDSITVAPTSGDKLVFNFKAWITIAKWNKE